MKVTFPHMGTAYIAIKGLLDMLGVECYIPPVASKNILEDGVAHSPEFMCLPFKTILGDFIDGLEHGADTILFGGSCGNCRQGYYGDLHQEILSKLGYQFQYISINLSKMTFEELARKLGPLQNNKSKTEVYGAIAAAVRTVFLVDKLYALACRIRCRELHAGETDRIMQRFEAEVLNTHGFREIAAVIKTATQDLKNVSINKTAAPLHIVLIGEIFMLCDPFTNLEIERKLGRMGVDVTNTLKVGSWVAHHTLRYLNPIKLPDKEVVAAQPYIHAPDIGGHGIGTVGNAVLHSGDADGIIQVYPFTCMPEIIAQSALIQVQKDLGVPMMTLILDEMTGEAGYITRLEAFVDMLKMRKNKEATSYYRSVQN